MEKRIMIGQQWFNGEDDDQDYNGNINCQCGLRVHLYLNGGELDRVKCKCGRIYYMESPLIQTWMII